VVLLLVTVLALGAGGIAAYSVSRIHALNSQVIRLQAQVGQPLLTEVVPEAGHDADAVDSHSVKHHPKHDSSWCPRQESDLRHPV
jgi:hypothetical protein